MLDHPRELDHALQLELAPAAANAWPLEGVGEASCLVPQALAGGVQRDDSLHELRAGLGAAALGVLDLPVHLLERLCHRGQQVLDGLLARIDVAGGLRARVAQARFGQGEERLVVGFEGVGAQRLKRVAQLRLGLAVRLQPLGVDGAILVERVLKAGVRGARRQPAHQAADGETQNQRGDCGLKVYGHEYRICRAPTYRGRWLSRHHEW